MYRHGGMWGHGDMNMEVALGRLDHDQRRRVYREEGGPGTDRVGVSGVGVARGGECVCGVLSKVQG